jgi:hypothetical protein
MAVHIDPAGHHDQTRSVQRFRGPHERIVRRRNDLVALNPQILDLAIDAVQRVVDATAADFPQNFRHRRLRSMVGTRPSERPGNDPTMMHAGGETNKAGSAGKTPRRRLASSASVCGGCTFSRKPYDGTDVKDGLPKTARNPTTIPGGACPFLR